MTNNRYIRSFSRIVPAACARALILGGLCIAVVPACNGGTDDVPVEVVLSAATSGPLSATPDPLNFPVANFGDGVCGSGGLSCTYAIATLKNNGATSQRITGASATGPFWVTWGGTCNDLAHAKTIAGGASCTLQFGFMPTAVNATSTGTGSVTFASGRTVTLSLRGVSSPLSWVNVGGRITASGAQVIPIQPIPSGTYRGDLWESGHDYPIVEMETFPAPYGDLNNRHAPMSTLIKTNDPVACPQSADHSCLQFEGFESRVGGHNDRIEIDVSSGAQARGPNGPLVIGEWRYLRFDLLIDPSTAPIGDCDVIVSQIWQVHNGGPDDLNWKIPALAVRVSDLPRDCGPTAGLCLAFDSGHDLAVSPGWERSTFHSEPIQKGVWNRFFIAMRPVPIGYESQLNPPRSGAVIIWKNKPLDWVPVVNAANPPINATTTFAWGYTPFSSGGAVVKDTFDTRVGIYRNGGAANPVRFRMDNIKFTADENNLPGP